MCRIAGYVGRDPLTLSGLFYDPPHSLERMSYAPRELLSGTVNVDGTGAAWWPGPGSDPLRYVTTQPPWSDPNLPGLAPALSGTTVLGSVRSATPGLPFGPANVHPFVAGGLAGAHNGWIGGFGRGVGRALLARLSDERFAQLDAMNDSLALFLLTVQGVDEGMGLARAVAAAVEATAKTVTAADERATLNLVVAGDGEIVAARTSVGTAINSLYVRSAGGASYVASEPLDPDDDWTAVEDHALVVLTPDGISTSTLEMS